MTSEKICLDSQILEDASKVREIVRDISPRDNLYRSIITEFSDGTRNTRPQLGYIEAYETALGVFRAASLELRRAMDVLTLEQRLVACTPQEGIERMQSTEAQEKTAQAQPNGLKEEINNAIFFSNRYALYFAGNVGLALLDSNKADIKSQFAFGTKYDPSKERDLLTSQLAAVAVNDIKRIVADKKERNEKLSDDDIKFTLEAIFSSWVNQFSWSTFADVAKARCIDEVVLQYKGFSSQKGNFKRKFDTVELDEKFMNFRKEDVIAAGEFGDVLWANFMKLACYKPDRNKNPLDPACVIFVHGDPGCGKTYTAHAYIRSLADFCKSKGLPLKAFTHSTTDYASHYQNKTANELARLGEEIRNFQGIVVMYVADADNIFQSRKDPRLTSEQQQTLGVYFKMFDGSMIPRNGKFLAVMDANYIEGIDDATKSRIFDEIVQVKRFTKAEDFAELSRRTLTGGLGGFDLPQEDWKAVGEYLLTSPLSNREIGHILRKIRGGFRIDEDVPLKAYEEIATYRNEQLRTRITRDNIIDSANTYITTRMEMERAAAEAKFRDGNERFLKFITLTNPQTADKSEAG